MNYSRLLVCGDRNWSDEAMVERYIRQMEPKVVIHGAARGADTLAGRVAKRLGIPVLEYPAQWRKYGRAAGPIRNQHMLVAGQPTHVCAFHDDIEHSKGTRDMLHRARNAGIGTTLLAHGEGR